MAKRSRSTARRSRETVANASSGNESAEKTVTPSDGDPSLRHDAAWLGGSVLLTVLVLWSGVPLGIPGEWVWPTRPASFLIAGNLVVPVAVVGLYLAAVEAMVFAVRSAAVPRAIPLLGLVCAGTVVSIGVQSGVGGVSGLMRSTFLLFDDRASGYFTESRPFVDDLAGFLDGYEDTVAEGEYLHQGTHPPGLITGYILLDKLVRSVPALQSFSEAIRSPEAVDAAEVLAAYPEGPGPQPYAVLHLFALATVATCAAAVVPIWLLLRPTLTDEAAFRVAALWPLLPSLIVFAPKSDLLLPIFPLTVAVLWRTAVTTAPSVAAYARAAAAGLVAGAGLCISLAVLPTYAAVAIGGVAASRGLRPGWKPVAALVASGAGGVAVWIAGFGLAGANLLAIWSGNLANHARFYDYNPRTDWAWLAVNPVEASLAVTLPLVVFAAVHWRQVRPRPDPATTSVEDASRRATRFIAFGVLIAWAMTWLSGKNMGEAARLWIVFDPWVVLVAGLAIGPSLTPGRWRLLAIAIGIASVATVLRVDGFGMVEQLSASPIAPTG